MSLVPLFGGAVGCWSPEHSEHGEHESKASWTTTEGAPGITRAADLREHQMKVAREGFLAAESSTPPPPVGSTVPLLRLSRPSRSTAELGQRLITLLSIMELALEPPDAAAWADAAASATHAADSGDPSILEPSPGVIVVHDPELDALLVVNTMLLDMDIRIDTDVVPWEDALRVAGALTHAGITEASLPFEAAKVAFVRSGVAGPDGTHEQWVDETIFEVRPRVDGIDILDAGVRVGITPTGGISSLRVAGIVAERVGTMTVGATSEALRDAFSEYLLGSVAAFESVHVSTRRPVYVLNRGVDSAIVEPHYLIEYSIVVRDGDALSASRSTITLWDMSSPLPTLDARLPPSSGS